MAATSKISHLRKQLKQLISMEKEYSRLEALERAIEKDIAMNHDSSEEIANYLKFIKKRMGQILEHLSYFLPRE